MFMNYKWIINWSLEAMEMLMRKKKGKYYLLSNTQSYSFPTAAPQMGILYPAGWVDWEASTKKGDLNPLTPA